MSNEQIKDYLEKYKITSVELLAKHIEELKRNTKPNSDIIFSLVDLYLNEAQELTPLFLDEVSYDYQSLGGGNIKNNTVTYTSTRHKVKEEGNFHKEILGNLEGINRGEKETMEALNNLTDVVNKSEVEIIKEVLEENKEPMFIPGFGFTPKRGKIIQYKSLEKKGVKHNQLKPRLDVVINTQFPKALQLISLATEYGNSKYKETDLDMLNFKRVVGGSQTYFDSCARHSTDRNGIDESGLPHIIHAVWSSLAGLELWVEENNINVKEFTENYMKNL